MTREQFIDFVRAEQERLRRFLLALCCGREAEADDMAQDALMKAYLACDTYDDSGRFAAWLYKIAYNVFFGLPSSPPPHAVGERSYGCGGQIAMR